MTTLGIYFLLALGSSLVLTPLCRMLAHRSGFIAKPKEDRWHKRPTAMFGGVAIATTVLALGAWIAPDVRLWQLMGCATLIAAAGLVDDLLSLKSSTKLIVQIIVASLLLFFGFRLHWTQSLVGDAMLTVFWIVGVTNAFNLLDNMDGLCAGTVLVAGTFLLIGMVHGGEVGAPALYLTALLGATAGFLVYNVHPASIFMGDTGSLFLGLNIATLTLMVKSSAAEKPELLSVIAVPVLLLLIPIFDTTLVTAARVLSGRRPSQGGRDHTSHRLVAIGLSQRSAVRILWLLSAAGGGIALSFRTLGPTVGEILTAGFLIAMIIFAVYLARIRVYEDADFARLREGSITPLVVDFMYKRRVAEVILDLCLIPLSYYAAYHLRFEGARLTDNYSNFLASLPIVLIAQMLALFLLGGYRGVWRHFGMMDAVVFVKSVVLGTVGAQVAILYMYRFESYSRAVFVIHAALLTLLLCGSRASFRLLGEFVQRRRSGGDRYVIYGTGPASIGTIREAFGEHVPMRTIGFIDDDRRQRELRVSGFPVLGDFERLLTMIERDEVDCVVLNTHIIDTARLKQLEAACQQQDVSLLRLHVEMKPLIAVS
jgi:UDP-GlcNAc:undecaprenyl-phosphate/decaprenyl-phosphate GlcNAc-1-phosphate transferase